MVDNNAEESLDSPAESMAESSAEKSAREAPDAQDAQDAQELLKEQKARREKATEDIKKQEARKAQEAREALKALAAQTALAQKEELRSENKQAHYLDAARQYAEVFFHALEEPDQNVFDGFGRFLFRGKDLKQWEKESAAKFESRQTACENEYEKVFSYFDVPIFYDSTKLDDSTREWREFISLITSDWAPETVDTPEPQDRIGESDLQYLHALHNYFINETTTSGYLQFTPEGYSGLSRIVRYLQNRILFAIYAGNRELFVECIQTFGTKFEVTPSEEIDEDEEETPSSQPEASARSTKLPAPLLFAPIGLPTLARFATRLDLAHLDKLEREDSALLTKMYLDYAWNPDHPLQLDAQITEMKANNLKLQRINDTAHLSKLRQALSNFNSSRFELVQADLSAQCMSDLRKSMPGLDAQATKTQAKILELQHISVTAQHSKLRQALSNFIPPRFKQAQADLFAQCLPKLLKLKPNLKAPSLREDFGIEPDHHYFGPLENPKLKGLTGAENTNALWTQFAEVMRSTEFTRPEFFRMKFNHVLVEHFLQLIRLKPSNKTPKILKKLSKRLQEIPGIKIPKIYLKMLKEVLSQSHKALIHKNIKPAILSITAWNETEYYKEWDADKLASRTAHKYAELDDLVQNGVIGLMNALLKFDSRVGAPFQTSAEFEINNATRFKKGTEIIKSAKRLLPEDEGSLEPRSVTHTLPGNEDSLERILTHGSKTPLSAPDSPEAIYMDSVTETILSTAHEKLYQEVSKDPARTKDLRYLEAFRLKYLSGLPNDELPTDDEVAARLSIPRTTARDNIKRGQILIRGKISDLGYDLEAPKPKLKTKTEPKAKAKTATKIKKKVT